MDGAVLNDEWRRPCCMGISFLRDGRARIRCGETQAMESNGAPRVFERIVRCLLVMFPRAYRAAVIAGDALAKAVEPPGGDPHAYSTSYLDRTRHGGRRRTTGWPFWRQCSGRAF